MQHALEVFSWERAKTSHTRSQFFPWCDGRRHSQPQHPAFPLYRLRKNWHLVKSHAHEHLQPSENITSLQQFKQFYLHALFSIFNHSAIACIKVIFLYVLHHRMRGSWSIKASQTTSVLHKSFLLQVHHYWASWIGFWGIGMFIWLKKEYFDILPQKSQS